MKKLPVTVVSGFSRAGKTTLVNHLLQSRPDLRIAVIVNRVEPEGFENELAAPELPGNDQNRVQMSDGCICCTLRQDLLEAIAAIAVQDIFDYLLVEAGCTSQPLPIAEIFEYVDEQGCSLGDLAELDTLVTVVDAEQFLIDFQSDDELRDRGLADDEDDQDVSQILADQVEFANVIVLNKLDHTEESKKVILRSFLQQLNPHAIIVETQQGTVDPDSVISTGMYSPEWVAEVAADLGNDHPETSEEIADELLTGDELSTIAYRSRRPFHPARFFEFWMSEDVTVGIMRTRGFFWLATRHDTAGFWSQTGRVLSAQPAGPWWAESPREEWPVEDPDMIAEIESVWDPTWGDRRQELKILLKSATIPDVIAALNDCLLTDEEMAGGPEQWSAMEDPFETWDESGAEETDSEDMLDDDEPELHDHDCSRDHDRR